MLRRLFEWLDSRYLQPNPAVSEVAPAPLIKKDPDTIRGHSVQKASQPLLQQHLQQVAVLRWPVERLLFHGCTDNSEHTDVARKRLDGDFKWMSEDPAYAADYAFYQGPESGRPLLFVCTLQREAIALQESQTTLHRLTNWGNAAPWRFPVEFGAIASGALGTEEPILFLDHFDDDTGKWGEILIPDPAKSLVVLEVVSLPSDKEEARRVAANSAIR